MADDGDFTQTIMQMFDMDEDAVDKLLDQLDAEALTALTDAVAKEDKEAAAKIIKTVENASEELNALLRGKKHVEHDTKTKPVRPKQNHQFAIGDDVAVRTGGKFVTATVYKPDAPGDTVGVKIDGKPKMVDRAQIYLLNEMVLGMTRVPNLERMQQLAGIMPSVAPPVVQQTVAQPRPAMDDDAACQAMAAIDVLTQVLPDVRLNDLKTIRQRLVDLQCSINENCGAGTSRIRKN